MTNEEAIEYWEQFNAEIDDLYDACSDADRDVLVKQREIVEYTISALRQQEPVTNRNEPLTLDELRKMDGEPVYCVEITGREEWLFRRDGGFADMYGEFTSDDFMVWDNYGKLWWCYRQKPEEGTV